MTQAATSQTALATATRIMRALTGRRWTWPRRHVTERYWIPETVDRVSLVGRPVSGVNYALDKAGNYYSFELSDGFQLYFPGLRRVDWPFFPWPGYDINGGLYPWAYRRAGVEMEIDYVYGNKPPTDVQLAIDILARELDLAAAGDAACRLPERVTSVSREGVSWTILDPQQFLVGGKLGLYYPDLIISAYNGAHRTMARAKVYSPEYKPPRRIFSETIDSDLDV